MNFYWHNRKNQKKLILFFNGFSLDENPFQHLDCGDFDVLNIYDYNEFDFERIKQICDDYESVLVFGFSFGVFIATLFLNYSKKATDKIIFLNGTLKPIDSFFGIPEKIFDLTPKNFNETGRGKFYQKMFSDKSDFERFLRCGSNRTLVNQVSELEKLQEISNINQDLYIKPDKVLIGKFDKIFNCKNQIEFWKDGENNFIDSGHFPFFTYDSWEEIIK